MAKTKDIKLTDLLVNTENYRFEPIASQKEAIDKMVYDQGDKLYNLAEHIVENGLNPNDRVQVTTSNHDKTKFNVLEGNRRIVVLKLLHTPDLIDSGKHSALKKKFKKLHEKHKAQAITELECTLYEDPSEADKWIKLKHAGQSEGIGTVAWNAQQVQRFEEKVEGKSSIALQTIKVLQNSPDVPADIKSNLAYLKITNLDRLLADPDVRGFLGIEINNGVIQSEVAEEEVINGLIQVAKDLLNPKFNVKRIYTKEDRRDYIKQFAKSNKPNTNNKATKPWQFNASTSGLISKPTAKTRPNPIGRSTLIPKTCALKIKNPKVNAVYHELQKLKIDNFTNAAAVLLRVFVELSLDCYIEDNKLTTANIDSTLFKKVTEVAQHLETNKLADKHICKGIRSSASNKNDLIGIETWNAYVHNPKFSPTVPNLIVTWDNIQSFIERVWENIK